MAERPSESTAFGTQGMCVYLINRFSQLDCSFFVCVYDDYSVIFKPFFMFTFC